MESLGQPVWYHLLMATRLQRLWSLFAVVAMAAVVMLIATGADGEERRHRPPCSVTERMTAERWCVPDTSTSLPHVKTAPRAQTPRNTKRRKGRSGTRVKVKAPGQWVLIRAGSFMMGSPSDEPGRGDDEIQHRVTITRDFLLQSTEVTQGQWQEVMGNNPSYFKNCGRDCPVEKVTWFEAVAYNNALSKREGLPECYRLGGCTKSPGYGMVCTSVSFEGLSCRGYRLPTEAEWEYAARAGTKGPLYGNLHMIAWYFTNSSLTTHPIGQKQPNRWGLFDIFGNTREWCHDWYGPFTSGSTRDPIGPPEGSKRVRRGGAWFYLTSYTRAADRMGCTPDYRRSGIGIRPARSLPGH